MGRPAKSIEENEEAKKPETVGHDEEQPKSSSEKRRVEVQTNAKEDQAVRDAHFFEDGVKADGTGGKEPESDA